MLCPGCANPISEQERLTGRCAKDGQPIDQLRHGIQLKLEPTAEPFYSTSVGEADEDGLCAVQVYEDGRSIAAYMIRCDHAVQWAAQEAECLNDHRPLEEKLRDPGLD